MKKILFPIFALTCIMFYSCGLGSSKRSEKDVLNDSLILVTLQQQNEISDLVATLNDVSSELDKIDGSIAIQNEDEKAKMLSKREELLMKLQDVQRAIQDKHTQLDELQKKYNAAIGSNKTLKSTIERMQSEINTYVEKLQQYKAELSQKNSEIASLNTSLESANETINTVVAENEENKNVIDSQDKMLNAGFYIIATKHDLKDLGLVKDNVFTAAKLSNNSYDPSMFNKVDIRELSELPLGAKSAKVLSSMPKDSYQLVEQNDKTLKLVIKDPSAFWSITRFLVVMVK